VVKMSNKDVFGSEGNAVSAKSLADLISEEISEEEKVMAKPAVEKATPKKSVALRVKKTKKGASKASKKSTLIPKGPKAKDSKVEKAKAAFSLRSALKPRKPENPIPEAMALFNSPPVPPGPSFPGQMRTASFMQNRMSSRAPTFVPPKRPEMPSRRTMVSAANYMNMQRPVASSMNRPPMTPGPYNRGASASNSSMIQNRQFVPSAQANFAGRTAVTPNVQSRQAQFSQNIPPRNPHVSGNVPNNRFTGYSESRASSPVSRPNFPLSARPNMPFNRRRF